MQEGETTPSVVAGKPPVMSGSYGREKAPGRSVAVVACGAADYSGWDLLEVTVAVRRFGSVGAPAARLLDEWGATVVAVSDVDGAVYDTDAVEDHDECPGVVSSYDVVASLTNRELLELDVDVVIHVAVGNVITADNAHDVCADLVVEGANGPTTFATDTILAERGVTVVPDILANADGVTVLYSSGVRISTAASGRRSGSTRGWRPRCWTRGRRSVTRPRQRG